MPPKSKSKVEKVEKHVKVDDIRVEGDNVVVLATVYDNKTHTRLGSFAVSLPKREFENMTRDKFEEILRSEANKYLKIVEFKNVSVVVR